MTASSEYTENLEIVINALLPQLDEEAKDALVWLIADFLRSLDGIYQSMPE